MTKVKMDDLKRLHDAARGTGGITSRDGQQFCIQVFERFPDIYKVAKSLTRCNNVFGTVLTNIKNMSAEEASQRAPGSARCVLEDMREEEQVKVSQTGLLPCPWCGGVELTQFTFPETESKPAWAMVQCSSCGATGPCGETVEQARLKWDLRGIQA